MIKIVWFSNRGIKPSTKQCEWLTSRFGPYHMIHVNSTFTGIQELVDKYESVEGEEMIVLIPDSMIKELCKLGYQPLKARFVDRVFTEFYRITEFHFDEEPV